VTLPEIALKDYVKMDTDLPLILPVNSVPNYTVKNVTKIKKSVPPALTDGDYGNLLPPEKKPPQTLNVNNVKLDALNVKQTEKYVLNVIPKDF
jgi:hypothetical protein